MIRLTLPVVAVITCSVVLFGQSAAPPQTSTAQAAPPVPAQFKLSTDLVRLDVSVLDKNRHPVRGLAATNFTVLENGKPQPVTAFSAVDVPDPTPPSAPWMRDVAPDVRNNADAQQRRLFIIAIDDATIENDPAPIKSVKQIARGVVDRLGPSDVASVVFTRDNRNSQDFTSDHARLLKAVDSFTVGFRGQGTTASGAAGSGAGGGRTAGGATAASDPGNLDDLWFLYSVGVLDRAVDYLTDVSERRKAIIYIGEGIPFDITNGAGTFNATAGAASGGASTAALQARIKDQMEDIFDRAQRANVTVYTVDACGLRRPAMPPVQGAKATPATCVQGNEVDYLQNVAAETGGRAVVNANDFNPGLDAVFQENASYYLLGFQPADPTKDGKFRKVEVKVNRPDLEVRTRSGYDAPREESPDRPRPTPSPLMKALGGVVPKSDLPMQMTGAAFAYVGPMQPDKVETTETPADAKDKKAAAKAKKDKTPDVPKPEASVLIAVGFKQPIRQSDEQAIENVELQISAFNTDGRSFGNTRSLAAVTIRPGSSGMGEYEVFGQIDLKPGRYQLRIAANLESFADTGSVYYDVDVPDFANDPVSMSGLLLTATPGTQFAPKSGLQPTVPVVPTTRRVFTPGHAVSAFTRVYQGGKAKLVDLTAHVTIRDAKDAVVLDKRTPLPASQFAATRAADLTFDLPVADLPPGDYVLTVETPSGTSTIRRDSRFSIAK